MNRKVVLKRERAGSYTFGDYYIFRYKDEVPSHWCVGWVDPKWGASALSDHCFLREARVWLETHLEGVNK